MVAPTVVVVCRTVEGWQAVVAGHDAMAARSLQGLDRRIRALTHLEPVVYQFRTGNDELDRLIRRVRITRAAARRYEERSRRLTRHVVAAVSGLSQRELSVLLGLSYQRVCQLVEQQRERDQEHDTDVTTSVRPLDQRYQHPR